MYCGWEKGQIRGSETSRRLFSFWQETMGPDLGGMGKSESARTKSSQKAVIGDLKNIDGRRKSRIQDEN